MPESPIVDAAGAGSSSADSRPVFVIGLAMAGAVSAGAYTAGVFDFLMRALAAHEAEGARTGRGPKVVLKAISGTSAGGTTACLGVASLIDGLSGEGVAQEYQASYQSKATLDYVVSLGKLHDIWVKGLRLTGPEGLLATRDLAGDGPLLSALDGTAIDAAADKVLGASVWTGAPYGFIADPLDLFVTTTGIDGVVYAASFDGAGADARHLMARHGLARHFAIEGLGTHALGSPWLDLWRDRGIRATLPAGGGTVDFSSREALAANGARPTVWTELRETGVATGAFPGGLSARFVRARMGEHGVAGPDGRAEGGAWPFDVDPALIALPDWGAAAETPGGDATYVAVDGGACNNEPFELARFAIRAARPAGPGGPPSPDRALAENPRGALDADRCVIMIDPFPEGPRFAVAWPDDPEGDARALPGLAGRLYGALIAQARFKPMELAAAMAEDVRSRRLIAPSRGKGAAQRRGAAAIASGALGGFSGFFDEAFRRHDYVLGQRNCQKFLRDYFKLAAGNPVMNGGVRDPALTDERPVLTLPRDLTAEIDEPEWPRMDLSALDAAFAAVGRRLDAVVRHTLRTKRPVWLARILAQAGWSVWGRAIARRWIERRIEAGLLAHHLIDARLPAAASDPFGRRVLATLVGPGPRVRTALGVAWAHARADARARALPRPARPDRAAVAAVEAVIEALSDPDVDARYRTRRYEMRDGNQTWTIGDRGPGWTRRNLPFLEVDDDLPRRR